MAVKIAPYDADVIRWPNIINYDTKQRDLQCPESLNIQDCICLHSLLFLYNT
jgi:hypothetical protein